MKICLDCVKFYDQYMASYRNGDKSLEEISDYESAKTFLSAQMSKARILASLGRENNEKVEYMGQSVRAYELGHEWASKCKILEGDSYTAELLQLSEETVILLHAGIARLRTF